MVKKILCMSVLCAFSIILVCCSSSVEPERFVMSFSDESGYSGFAGSVFELLTYRPDDKFFGYDSETLLQDIARSHIAAVEKANDCSISITVDGNAPTTLKNNGYASKYTADISYLQSGWGALDLAKAGFLIPLSWMSDYLDISDYDKYGPLNIMESSMVKGEVYGALPVYWPTKCYDANMGSFLIFNENVISRYGMPNPRELDENGQWTRENFFDLFPQYSYTEGNRTVCSLTAHKMNYARAFLGSDGMQMAYDNNGQIVAGYETPQVIQTIDWVRDLYFQYKDLHLFTDDYVAHEKFINGDATLCVVETQFVLIIANDVYDFGLVSFPCGPNTEYGKQATYYSCIDVFSLATLSENNEACAKIISDLCEPFVEYPDESSRFAILTDSIFFNDKDAYFFENLFRNTQYQYANEGLYSVLDTIGTSFNNMTGSEIINTYRGTYQKVIDEYVAPNYSYIRSQMSR